MPVVNSWVRKEVLKRQYYRCLFYSQCKAEAGSRKLDIHHLYYYHAGEGNQAEADDCVALCGYHHTLIHCNECATAHEAHLFEQRREQRAAAGGVSQRP